MQLEHAVHCQCRSPGALKNLPEMKVAGIDVHPELIRLTRDLGTCIILCSDLKKLKKQGEAKHKCTPAAKGSW
jgi:hypothetical protein